MLGAFGVHDRRAVRLHDKTSCEWMFCSDATVAIRTVKHNGGIEDYPVVDTVE